MSKLTPFLVGPLDRVGLVKDLSPEQVPDGGWQDAADARIINGRLQPIPGYVKFVSAAVQSDASKRIMYGAEYIKTDLNRYLVIVTLTKTYYYDTVTSSFLSIQDSNFTGSLSDLFTVENGFNYALIANGIDRARKWSGPGGNITNIGNMDDCEPGSITCIPKIIRAFAGFAVALNNTEAGSPIPTGVRWNKKDTLETWKNDVNGVGQAGSANLRDSPAPIMNGVPLNNFLVIYKQDSIYLMSYVGLPIIFQFTKVVTTRGLLAKEAVVNMGAFHYFLSDDDFYLFDGYNLKSIGSGIRDFFFNDVNPAYSYLTMAILVKQYGEIWWVYPAGASTVPNKLLIYSYRTNTWMPGLLSATALFFLTLQTDVSWASVPDLSWDATPQNWNDILLSKSQPQLMFGDDSSFVRQHGTVYSKDGAAYDKYATSKLYDFGRPGLVKRLRRVQFAVDANALDNLQVIVGTANNPADTITWGTAQAIVTGYGAPKIDVDYSAVYFAFKFISQGTSDPWQVNGFQAWFEQETMQ